MWPSTVKRPRSSRPCGASPQRRVGDDPGEVGEVLDDDADAVVLHQPAQGPVRPGGDREPRGEVLEGLVGQRGVEVGGVEAGVEDGPADVVGGQAAQQGRRLQGRHQAQPGRAGGEVPVLGRVAVGEDVDLEPGRREAARPSRRS